ncbi:MAG: NADH:ubiquinone oxidoreductase subunit NDUFA12 [Alphaproteobacteria bacterium]
MTITTRLHVFLAGKKVGTDRFGNRYYRLRGRRAGRDRRFVLYAGEPEASTVPPDWHAWLHHIVDELPSGTAAPEYSWEKPHIPNPTGTEAAYLPPGHVFKGAHRPGEKRDYEPWRPS